MTFRLTWTPKDIDSDSGINTSLPITHYQGHDSHFDLNFRYQSLQQKPLEISDGSCGTKPLTLERQPEQPTTTIFFKVPRRRMNSKGNDSPDPFKSTKQLNQSFSPSRICNGTSNHEQKSFALKPPLMGHNSIRLQRHNSVSSLGLAASDSVVGGRTTPTSDSNRTHSTLTFSSTVPLERQPRENRAMALRRANSQRQGHQFNKNTGFVGGSNGLSCPPIKEDLTPKSTRIIKRTCVATVVNDSDNGSTTTQLAPGTASVDSAPLERVANDLKQLHQKYTNGGGARPQQFPDPEQMVDDAACNDDPFLFMRLLRTYINKPARATLLLNAKFLEHIHLAFLIKGQQQIRNSDFVDQALDFIAFILDVFGDIIINGLTNGESMRRRSLIGIDFTAEERYERCVRCLNALVRFRVESALFTTGGSSGSGDVLTVDQRHRLEHLLKRVDKLEASTGRRRKLTSRRNNVN